MANKKKVFLEIGTCDFDTCLPLTEGNWKGYMVEANPKHAATMTEQAADSDVKVFNYAISDYDGDIQLLTSESESGDDWARGLSHISSDNHLGERLLETGRNKKYVGEEVTVPCLTLDSFLDEAGIKNLDYLQIDTEGHEVNILKDYSWKVKPSFIKVEHFHVDDILLAGMLEAEGYYVWVERNDIYGILK